MRAGELRHRLQLQERIEGQDPITGAIISEWQIVATVWGKVEPLSVRDFIASGALNSEITTRITIRYRQGVKPTMRIIHGEKIYDIIGVLPDKDSGTEYLTLPCTTLE